MRLELKLRKLMKITSLVILKVIQVGLISNHYFILSVKKNS
jgi:hypothetical protein